ACKSIRKESVLLGLFLLISISLSITISTGVFKSLFSLSNAGNDSFNIAVGGLTAGIVGGTTNSIKWLYHVVGRNLWNQDRLLWRIYTPFLSGTMSLFLMFGISSGLITIFSKEAVSDVRMILAIGFLSGYFSDNAFGKMAEI